MKTRILDILGLELLSSSSFNLEKILFLAHIFTPSETLQLRQIYDPRSTNYGNTYHFRSYYNNLKVSGALVERDKSWQRSKYSKRIPDGRGLK